MRYGKPYWDYDPCEVCTRDDCKGCEYYFEESDVRKSDQSDSCE